MSTHLIFHLGFVGDSILALPIAEALQRRFAGDRLVWVANQSMQDFFEGCPYADAWIFFDRKAPKHRSVPRLWRHCSAERPRLSFNLHTPDGDRQLWHGLRDSFFLGSVGTRQQYGWALGAERALLSHPHSAQHFGRKHMLEEMAAPLAPLELGLRTDAVALWQSESDEGLADQQLQTLAGKNFIALAPFGKRRSKEIDVPQWQAALRRVQARCALPFVLLGGPGEQTKAESLTSADGIEILNLVGQNSLLTCGAILKRARACLAIDSGLMHLANLVETPTVGLFGPMPMHRWAPMKSAPTALFVGRTRLDPDEAQREGLGVPPNPFDWEAITQTLVDWCR